MGWKEFWDYTCSESGFVLLHGLDEEDCNLNTATRLMVI